MQISDYETLIVEREGAVDTLWLPAEPAQRDYYAHGDGAASLLRSASGE